MKTCTACDTTKSLDMFHKNASRYDGFQSQCKACCSVSRKAHYLKNRDRELSINKTWAKENPDAVRAKQKRHRQTEKGKATQKAAEKRYAQSEHGSAAMNAKNARRRAAKLQATPAWLTEEQKADIKSMYALAKKFEALWGIEYHVDHIVPLAGKDVCGLHVPWNLQLLPASVNIAKGNKYNGEETLRARK